MNHFLNMVFQITACLLPLQSAQEKIESATDVLKAILKPVIDEEEEIPWPPRDPDALVLMQNVHILYLHPNRLYNTRCSC